MEKRPIHIKDNSYFHQKDDLINSFVHSSPKMKRFYLNSTLTPPRTSDQSTSSIQSNTQALRELALKRLQDRKLERESVRYKQLQQRCHQRAYSTENSVRLVSANCRQDSFENYNALPISKVKLLINDTVIRSEERSVKRFSRALEAEAEARKEKQAFLNDSKSDLQRFLKKRRAATSQLEQMSGIVRIRVGRNYHVPIVTERVAELAKSRPVKQSNPFMYSDTAGLIIRDHSDAFERARLESARTRRRSRPFTCRSGSSKGQMKGQRMVTELNIARPSLVMT